jgi:hypothetical protein
MSDWIEPILMMRPLLARSGAVNACVTLKDPVEVGCDYRLPVGGHGVRVGRERIAAGDAGIVHENGYLAELLGNLRRHRTAGGTVADVER